MLSAGHGELTFAVRIADSFRSPLILRCENHSDFFHEATKSGRSVIAYFSEVVHGSLNGFICLRDTIQQTFSSIQCSRHV